MAAKLDRKIGFIDLFVPFAKYLRFVIINYQLNAKE